jgi:hypothetical protein
LTAFYRQAAAMVRPGGWLVNLDHMAVSDLWGRRYDELTPRFYEETEMAGAVRKDRGGHAIETHLESLAATGLTDVDTPWRLLSTVLLLARRPI